MKITPTLLETLTKTLRTHRAVHRTSSRQDNNAVQEDFRRSYQASLTAGNVGIADVDPVMGAQKQAKL